MKRIAMLSGCVLVAIISPALAQADNSQAPSDLETMTVTATRLNNARNGIQTQLGASTYTIDSDTIENAPGGTNSGLNQVILQAPGTTQDSFGQLHIRGEHNGIQYRLNGVILPEGINVFSQTLDPKLVSSVKLITGALPAQYGLRTAGIIDIETKSGLFAPGGSVSLYGGSHGTFQPSFTYGGSSGSFNYFVSGDFLRNGLGLESPDGSSTPEHDRTNQYHGFGYFEDILDSESRLTLVLGTSHERFQIPNSIGLSPDLGLTVNGETDYPSTSLNENQREVTQYAIASYLFSGDVLDSQISLFGRSSSLKFTPDALGDLLYDGISQNAEKRDRAYGIQIDNALHLGDAHTLRAGLVLQMDRTKSNTSSFVLPVDATGVQTSDVPLAIADDSWKTATSFSFYLQDEWKLLPQLTLNYGARFDTYRAYIKESQLSPRINMVWQPIEGTSLHAGYSRYFSPPPYELVGNETVTKFSNTTAAPENTQNDTPRAERAHYFDIGIEQQFDGGLTLGIDTYYKISQNLLDEGQFGAPIVLTPFNYKNGRQYGVELTASYDNGPFSAYSNFGWLHARGKDIVSSQFNFGQDDLDFITDHYIHLDHEQRLSASAGMSYSWEGSRISADMIYGSGLRSDGAVPNGRNLPAYIQVNLGASHEFDFDSTGKVTLRFDVINLFDEKYQIRDGTGIGVGAPQYGARRGFFFGISKAF